MPSTARRVAGVLKGFPSAFEKNPLLGIEDLCLARRITEETGIELVALLRDRALADDSLGLIAKHSGTPASSRSASLNVSRDFDPVADVAPEIIELVRAGKPAGKANDRDGVGRECLRGDRLSHGLA